MHPATEFNDHLIEFKGRLENGLRDIDRRTKTLALKVSGKSFLMLGAGHAAHRPVEFVAAVTARYADWRTKQNLYRR